MKTIEVRILLDHGADDLAADQIDQLMLNMVRVSPSVAGAVVLSYSTAAGEYWPGAVQCVPGVSWDGESTDHSSQPGELGRLLRKMKGGERD